MFRPKRMLIFNPQLNLPKYKTRVSAKFYANLRLFTKFKSLILQLYYLPILDLQNLNHPGGSISFFAQKIADFKPTNTIVKIYKQEYQQKSTLTSAYLQNLKSLILQLYHIFHFRVAKLIWSSDGRSLQC